ncbi:MAG: YgaP-like transmembrane domain [Rubrobacteraceae bacterium]
MAFAKFMSEPIGRIIRAAAGIALIALAFFVGGTAGLIIGIVGLVPIAAGVFNFCLLGPLVGGYFSGRKNLESPPQTRGGAAQH